MQRAPTSSLLHQEILRRLRLLHQYDVLRCDRYFVLLLFNGAIHIIETRVRHVWDLDVTFFYDWQDFSINLTGF